MSTWNETKELELHQLEQKLKKLYEERRSSALAYKEQIVKFLGANGCTNPGDTFDRILNSNILTLFDLYIRADKDSQ
jgi:hypothetical protein